MTYFAPEIIRRNIMHSIGPVLDKADALLDHYLQDAPREVWEPIADDLNPGRADENGGIPYNPYRKEQG